MVRAFNEILAVNGSQEIGIDNVKIMRGHEKEVFACAWNPNRDLLATASGDSTARLWAFDDVCFVVHVLVGPGPDVDDDAGIGSVPEGSGVGT